MRVLGLDIGTTTISAVVVENGQVLQALTRPNGSFLQDRERWEKLQDPKRIRATALSMVDELFRLYPDVERIGVTGQMHGIVYLNRLGEPVSPLYTWQDGRGEEPTSTGETLVSWIRRRTGYPVATGYGLVTHCYNLRHGLVPVEAAVFCTIHDYIAMTLGGQSKPVLDASDAASFGLFDVARGAFDLEAMEKADVTPDMSISDICDALKTSMTEITVDGLTGTQISWTSDGEPSKDPIVVQVEGGKYKVLE